MGTMLDCINRIPSIINNILDTRDKNYKELIERGGIYNKLNRYAKVN
mgnify:CR=1 FL=1